MLSQNPSKIHIHITTYKSSNQVKIKKPQNMEQLTAKHNITCSICLKAIDDSKMARRHKTNCYSDNHKKVNDSNLMELSTKHVQTTPTDIFEGRNLLNEVLKVFKDKRNSSTSETKIFKDVGVCTIRNSIPRLTFSKTCNISIENKSISNNHENKYTIVHSKQPEFNKYSNCSMNLIKNKSSSIPQMKLEELKYSLKAKTSSRDTIEEVNRLFATINVKERKDINNRPVLRSGPRVLPTVRTIDSNIPENKANVCNISTIFSSGDAHVLHKHDKVEMDEFNNINFNKLCSHCRKKINAVERHNLENYIGQFGDFM